MSSAGKPVAVVTGAGTGIGAAIALELHERGYRLGIGTLEEHEGAGVADQVRARGGEALVVAGDLTESSVRERLIDGTADTFGRLDTLVNNAAVTGEASVADAMQQPIDRFERIVDVNLTAAFACAQLAARIMREQGGGSIVNISSVAGTAAQQMAAAYCASKGALDALTRALALEWASYGIRVNAVAPGDIETEASKDIVDYRRTRQETGTFDRKTPLARRGTPGEIANVVGFLASDKASFMTGEVVRVDGGFLCY